LFLDAEAATLKSVAPIIKNIFSSQKEYEKL